MCCALNSSEAPNERSLWRRQGCGAREHVRITLGKMLAVPRRPCLRVFWTEHVAPTIDDGGIRGPIRAVMGPSNEAWHYPQAMIDGLSDLVNQREEISKVVWAPKVWRLSRISGPLASKPPPRIGRSPTTIRGTAARCCVGCATAPPRCVRAAWQTPARTSRRVRLRRRQRSMRRARCRQSICRPLADLTSATRGPPWSIRSDHGARVPIPADLPSRVRSIVHEASSSLTRHGGIVGAFGRGRRRCARHDGRPRGATNSPPPARPLEPACEHPRGRFSTERDPQVIEPSRSPLRAGGQAWVS